MVGHDRYLNQQWNINLYQDEDKKCSRCQLKIVVPIQINRIPQSSHSVQCKNDPMARSQNWDGPAACSQSRNGPLACKMRANNTRLLPM